MRPLLGLVLALAVVGCQTTPSSYFRSRAGDALDVIPVSFGYGHGLGMSFRATSAFHVGLSAWPVRARRLGYDDRVVRGVWREYAASFPWTFYLEENGELPPVPVEVRESRWEKGVPIVYRWQSMRAAPQAEGTFSRGSIPDVLHLGRHPSYVRESIGALLIPEVRRRVDFREFRLTDAVDPMSSSGTPDAAVAWQAERGGERIASDWDRFEADLFVGFVGLRFGLRPWQLVDFLAGWFQFDPAGDDLPAPVTFEADTPDE